tara:strand:- start:246 stop:434 length:189 start_codon:yes stop_codon:yes gene_type:complete
MNKRLFLGILIGGGITLLTQKALEVRQDMKKQREIYPRNSYYHFRKLEQAARDRLTSYGQGQ